MDRLLDTSDRHNLTAQIFKHLPLAGAHISFADIVQARNDELAHDFAHYEVGGTPGPTFQQNVLVELKRLRERGAVDLLYPSLWARRVFIDTTPQVYDPSLWFEDENKQWSPTTDGRLVAVIQRDEDPTEMDGDGLAPLGYVSYGASSWNVTRWGATFEDDDVLAGFKRAIDTWGRYDTHTERFMRIFYGTTFLTVDVDRSADMIVVFNTPAFREHVGATDESTELIVGERDEVIARRDGDVWGIGYGTYTGEDDVSGAEPRGDDFQLFDITIECWGFVGEKYAREAAAAFEAGKPELKEV